MFIAHSVVYMTLTMTLAGAVDFFASLGFPPWFAYATILAEALGDCCLSWASKPAGLRWLSLRSCLAPSGCIPATAGCLLLLRVAGSILFIFLCFASPKPCSGMALMRFLRRGCLVRARPLVRLLGTRPILEGDLLVMKSAICLAGASRKKRRRMGSGRAELDRQSVQCRRS